VAGLLTGHKDLAIHTELFADPMVDLMESGAVTGIYKRSYVRRAVATFALGTKRLYDFLDNNDGVVFLPVNETNDPRRIGREPKFVSVNASLEVDLIGQCASETLGTRYFSGSGGQADFARGAQYSRGGNGYIVLPSTTRKGKTRIVPTLKPGAVVTTMKNTVDHVVTEWGVATLRGGTLDQRARALIDVAHPDHRDALTAAARKQGLILRHTHPV
jgi:acyl-CoA hydrolase